jgi:hypothetical protein
LPDLEEEYGIADYNLSIANSREEYEHAREIFNEIEGRYNAAMEKESTAREQVERLGAEVPDLLEDYNTKKGEREVQATFLKDEAGLEDVEAYDPTEGPPELPEEADAASTGDDATAGDAAAGDASAGDASAGDASATGSD